jgi:hypothetical protein
VPNADSRTATNSSVFDQLVGGSKADSEMVSPSA